jgi:hypothetical protein
MIIIESFWNRTGVRISLLTCEKQMSISKGLGFFKPAVELNKEVVVVGGEPHKKE